MPNEKRVDWDAIRAEYIAGGTSYRKLAKKHNITAGTLTQHAIKEGWVKLREEAVTKAIANAQQKTASASADNAVTAARIRAKLLFLLESRTDEVIKEMSSGTASRKSITDHIYNDDGKIVRTKDVQTEQKIKDLAAMFKDLTADMVTDPGRNNELLQALYNLEKRNG